MKFLDDIKKYYLYRSFNKRLAMPVWFLFMIDQGLSIQQITLIAGLSTLISFLFEIPSGSIADTIGHRKALILAAIGQGIGLALFVGGTVWWILAGSLTYWGLGSLMTGTHEAFFFEKLISLNRKDEYQKLMGRARSVSSTFSAILVATAGVLYVLNPGLPFIASACIYFLSALMAWSFIPNLKHVSVEKREGYSQWASHISAGWKSIHSSALLFWIIILDALIIGVVMSATEMQQIILNNISLAVPLFGVLYMIKRFFSASVSPFLHHLRPHLNPVRTLSFMVGTLFLYLLFIGTVTSHLAIFFVVLLASFTIVINDILVTDYKNQLISSGSRATTLSMANFANNLIKLLALAFFGIVTTFVSIEYTHLILAIIFVGPALFLLPKLARAYKMQIKQTN